MLPGLLSDIFKPCVGSADQSVSDSSSLCLTQVLYFVALINFSKKLANVFFFQCHNFYKNRFNVVCSDLLPQSTPFALPGLLSDIFNPCVGSAELNGRKRTGSSIRDQRVDFIDFLKPGRQGSLPKKRGLHLLGTILYVSVRDWPPPGNSNNSIS